MSSMRLPIGSRRLTVGIVATVLALSGVGVAMAATAQPAIQTSTPRTENQITNLDVLRQQIRNYYGDPLGTGTFADTSNYAKEAQRVAFVGSVYLAARSFGAQPGARRAIVLDVDDTTLATWNYEIFSNWAYNPATNGDFVLGQRFPAVPGMVALVNAAKQRGYAIFYLTGRPASQEAATLGNLTSDNVGVDAGYPAPTSLGTEDGLFTKPAVQDYPQYLKDACAEELAQSKSCTTVHYKSATRAHIESVGFHIVANFGDQFSDLQGGYADRTFKIPNPNYFLP
jgi:hypothetical protein